jgi:hypothetical protein
LKRRFGSKPTRRVLDQYCTETGMVVTELHSRCVGTSTFFTLYADQRDRSLDMTFHRVPAFYRYDARSGALERLERDHPEIKKMAKEILKNRNWIGYFLFRLRALLT